MSHAERLAAPHAAGDAGGAGITAHLDEHQVSARRAWIRVLRGEHPGSLQPGEWNALADEAIRHQLAALTWRKLEDAGITRGMPESARKRLRDRYVKGAFGNAALLRRTAELVNELAKAAIPVVLLKGAHLCRFVYPEPALRTMADVDLLVPRARLADAERIFLGLGFGPLPRPDLEEFCTRSNHLAKLFRSGSPVVELHWAIERPTNPFRIDHDGIWKRSTPARLETAPVQLLAPEDLLLHLCLHESYHHRFDWSALRGLLDIQQVIAAHPALDWSVLADRANAWGASGFVYATFRLGRELLGTPVPDQALERLEHEPGDDGIVELARQNILSPELVLPESYLELADQAGIRKRWRYIRDRVFLPRESLERMYGHEHAPVPVSYVRRVVDLIGRRGRLLLQSLFRTRQVRSALRREANRRRIEGWVSQRSGTAATPKQD